MKKMGRRGFAAKVIFRVRESGLNENSPALQRWVNV
jgi:hypothetical protein